MTSRIAFVIFGTVVLIGVLTYLQISFQGADVKTAIRLVEEAKADGVRLGDRMEKVLPTSTRLCEATVLNQFHGHMEVVCRDIRTQARELRWKVSVIDGLVKPANGPAEKLGKGEVPWSNEK